MDVTTVARATRQAPAPLTLVGYMRYKKLATYWRVCSTQG